jgi:anti-sigma factor RsiW
MSIKAELRDEDVHALIDDELDETGRTRADAAIEAHPDLRERIAAYRADKARLVSLYGGGLNEPLPREWIDRIERASARRPWHGQALGIAALAASLVLVLTGVLAYRQFARPARDDVVADALAARADSLRPEAVIPVASERVAEAEAGVMTRTLATRVKAPDLSRMGYRLVGIDIYSEPARSFELRYRDGEGRIFTLYLRKSSGTPRFDQFEDKGLRVCIWQDDVIGTVMAGKMSAAEMQRLASLAYTGLTL